MAWLMACCVQTWYLVNDFSPALKEEMGGLEGESFDFSKNMRCGTSAPPTGWFIGQRNKVAVGVWQGSSPFTSKGLFKWWPPPNRASWSKKYLKGTLKGIFSLMYLVGFWKILSTFFFIYPVLEYLLIFGTGNQS